MNFIKDFRALLIGLWLGAAVFFVAVAQSSFAVLPTRELAGALVSRTLSIINITGLIIALILLVTSFIKRAEARSFLLWAERIALSVVAICGAGGQFVIAIWLAYIRAQIGRPIDEVAADDPLRIQFNTLHEYSVWALMTGMIAALLAFFIILRKSDKNPVVDDKQEFKF